MSYTRRISVGDAAGTGYPHYLAAMPVGIESATMVSGYLGDGSHPPLHVHDVMTQLLALAAAPSGVPAVRLDPGTSLEL